MGHYMMSASTVFQSKFCDLFVAGNCNGTVYFNEIRTRGEQEPTT
jgi:hypothetical protein